ncbi:hypothetical protein VYU27_006826 [Nannochloropsis oceanica]
MKAAQRLVFRHVGTWYVPLCAGSHASTSARATNRIQVSAAAAVTTTIRPYPHVWTSPPKPAASSSTLPNTTISHITVTPRPSLTLELTAVAASAQRGPRRSLSSPSSEISPIAPLSSLLSCSFHPSSSSSYSSSYSSSSSSLSSSSSSSLSFFSSSSFFPQKRGIMTQAIISSSLRTQRLLSPLLHSLPSSSATCRHFWSPKFIRQLGLPWFAQVFYGTIFVIGVGVLAVSLFATSTAFAVLFLVAFAGFKLLNRQPHLMRQVMRRQRPPGAPPSFFGPLIDMMTDGVMLDGLKNARGSIERDVLEIINVHPKLGRYGTDFHTTGLHKMSMQVVNGADKHVVMQFLVASSKPREMFVQVVASRHEEEMGGEREGMERWEYEDVSVQTPDGKVIDLTEELLKGKTNRRIVIDVAPRHVKEEE